MTLATQASGTPEMEQPGTVSPAGNGQSEMPPGFDIGSFNTPGVDHMKVVTEAKIAASKETPAPVAEVKGTPEAKQQPTEKDERHMAQFITKAAQAKYDFAKLAVEADEEAIYKIAESDPATAERLLKEFDYGTDSVQELIEKKGVLKAKNPEQAAVDLQKEKRMQNMERELLDSKILLLRGTNPDLTGELEEKFREVYSDSTLADKLKTVEQKLEFARVLTGKTQKQSSATDVALAILSNEEGAMTKSKGTTQPEKMKVESPEFRRMKESMGVKDKDLEILPHNIDDLISQNFGTGK